MVSRSGWYFGRVKRREVSPGIESRKPGDRGGLSPPHPAPESPRQSPALVCGGRGPLP